MRHGLLVGLSAVGLGSPAIAETDLSTLRTQIEQAMVSEDLPTISAAFGQDVWIMPEYQKTMIGSDHAALYYKTLFDGIDIMKRNKDGSLRTYRIISMHDQ